MESWNPGAPRGTSTATELLIVSRVKASDTAALPACHVSTYDPPPLPPEFDIVKADHYGNQNILIELIQLYE